MIIYLNILPKNYIAITLFPFIVFKKKKYNTSVVLNHERIHLRQQAELLVIGFYVLYLVDFIIKLIKYKNWSKAYKNIVFEREAYTNQYNQNYLQTRKLWAFLK